jgi:hypothetical protein
LHEGLGPVTAQGQALRAQRGAPCLHHGVPRGGGPIVCPPLPAQGLQATPPGRPAASVPSRSRPRLHYALGPRQPLPRPCPNAPRCPAARPPSSASPRVRPKAHTLPACQDADERKTRAWCPSPRRA